MADREEIIDEKGEKFLIAVEAGQSESMGRVLYLRDISDISWIRNTYLGFEAAPVSVMYGNVDASAWGSQDIINALRDAHADYLYVDELAGDKEKLFGELLQEGEFSYGTLYRADGQSGILYPANY